MVIEFGNCCSIYYLVMLFIPVFESFYLLLLLDLKDEAIGLNLDDHPFFLSLYGIIIQCLGGIPVLIVYIRNYLHGYKKKEGYVGTNLILSVTNKDILKKRIKTVLIVFCLTIFNQLAYIISIICLDKTNDNDQYISDNIIILQLLMTGIFSYFMIRYPLYKHNFFATGLILVGFVFISFHAIIDCSNWYVVLCLIISCVIWAFLLVCDKWVMDILDVSPFMLIFLYGICGFCFYILLLVAFNYIPCNSAWYCYKGAIEKIIPLLQLLATSKTLWYKLLGMGVMYYIYFVLLNICNKKLSPMHTTTAEIFSGTLIWIYNIIEKSSINDSFYYALAGYCIVLFGALIYNEIIIINYCSLSEYTKKAIAQRSKVDSMIDSELVILEMSEY